MRWTASSSPTSETITIGIDKNKEVPISYFPEAKTSVEQINGTRNVRYFERSTAFVGGRWFAVGFYGLAVSAWNGTTWDVLVEEKAGEALFGQSGSHIDAIATDGTRAWAVATSGAVFEWTGEWKPLATSGGELFDKKRRFTRVAWDRKRERLVLWGGNNGPRSSNDTLWFEGGKWHKSAKPGTKLTGRKADSYWLYDDPTRGGVVRVGAEGCHLLDGGVWKLLDVGAPPFVTGKTDRPAEQMIVAHGEQTLWIDPIGGAVYREGVAQPIAEVGQPPGMVAMPVLRAAGAYFGADFERANDRDWLWTWDAAKRRAYGTKLGSTKFVCELDLSSI